MTVVVFRQKCKTCPRTYIPKDLEIAGLCPVCLENRIWNMDSRFCEDLKESKQRSDGFGYTCFECGAKNLLSAFVHWDVTAKGFSLLCRPCKAKAVQTAEQYKGTPFGYLQKAQ